MNIIGVILIIGNEGPCQPNHLLPYYLTSRGLLIFFFLLLFVRLLLRSVIIRQSREELM